MTPHQERLAAKSMAAPTPVHRPAVRQLADALRAPSPNPRENARGLVVMAQGMCSDHPSWNGMMFDRAAAQG